MTICSSKKHLKLGFACADRYMKIFLFQVRSNTNQNKITFCFPQLTKQNYFVVFNNFTLLIYVEKVSDTILI